MGAKIGWVVCGLLLVAAALMAQPPAEGRILTDAELSAVLGKIGDGCPCEGTFDFHCDMVDQCNNCKNEVGEWPIDPCALEQGRVYSGYVYPRCDYGVEDTCHNGSEQLCSKLYNCLGMKRMNYMCDYDPSPPGPLFCNKEAAGYYCWACTSFGDYLPGNDFHIKSQVCS